MRQETLLRSCNEIVGEAYDSLDVLLEDRDDMLEMLMVGNDLIHKDRLHGAAALCILDSLKIGFEGFWPGHFKKIPRTESLMFHGSPVPPEEMGDYIQPRSCHNIILPGDRGNPAVSPNYSSHSSGTFFPRIRSLLHHDHPDLKDVGTSLVFSRRPNMSGTIWSVTFRNVIERLIERESAGWVYASLPGLNHDFIKFWAEPERADQAEYRTIDPVRRSFAVRMSVSDLPARLIVLDGPEDAVMGYLKTTRESNGLISSHAKRWGVVASLVTDYVPETADKYCLHSVPYSSWYKRLDKNNTDAHRLCADDDRLTPGWRVRADPEDYIDYGKVHNERWWYWNGRP